MDDSIKKMEDRRIMRRGWIRVLKGFVAGLNAIIGLGATVMMPFTVAYMMVHVNELETVVICFGMLLLEGFLAIVNFQLVDVLQK